MKKMIVAVMGMLLGVACGGTAAEPTSYSITGRWDVYEGNSVVAILTVGAGASTGSYAEGYTGYPNYATTGPTFALSAAHFSSTSPDFTLDFSGSSGTRSVAGHLLAANSSVFNGSVGAQTVQGVWFGQ